MSPRDALVVINYLIEANAAANTLAAEMVSTDEALTRDSTADIDAAFAARIDLADSDARFESDDDRHNKKRQ